MLTFETNPFYCDSLTNYKRRNTRIVNIGNVPMGGNYPIRIQSMTSARTLDTKATVEQTIRLIEAGSEYVRITAPGIKDAENLRNIKAELRKQGYKIPLIADIHFNPKAAEIAAKHVEKVRINPGNFVDKKVFKTINYTETEYRDEVEKIRERLTPLLNICKEHETALRIGTNHGSLSDRIMSKYGDTPYGMVESAMEFLRICGEENFHNIVLSMKASNTRVMIQAYRLLVSKMQDENMNYPLHLGVTEAGEGEDGRIKSSVGIGTLLADGLGDTIRVSLTEEPEFEIPVAEKIVRYFQDRRTKEKKNERLSLFYNPYEFNKRVSNALKSHEAQKLPIVIITEGQGLNAQDDIKADYIFSNNQDSLNSNNRNYICDYSLWNKKKSENCFPLFTFQEYLQVSEFLDNAFLSIHYSEINELILNKIKSNENLFLILKTSDNNFIAELRLFFSLLHQKEIKNPVILFKKYIDSDPEMHQIKSSCDFGAILSDGFGDGIWIENENLKDNSTLLNTSFGILQACRLRISKTDYISCPSCGRTLFNLQDTTAKIREKTAHLKALKIGIMGCIVNGPGEMADADFGYVGTGPGKISLYKGHELVKKNIPAENAVSELIELIKKHGDWKEY